MNPGYDAEYVLWAFPPYACIGFPLFAGKCFVLALEHALLRMLCYQLLYIHASIAHAVTFLAAAAIT